MKALVFALVVLGIAFATSEGTSDRSPSQLLVDHINSLILAVRNEQTEHDAIYAIQKRECDDELKFRRKEVSDASDALTRATEHRGRCQAAFATANADLIRAKTYYQIFNDQLQSITQRRADEAAVFKRKSDTINNLLNLIDQAEQIVQEFANAKTSFLQVTRHFNSMFLEGAKEGMATEIAPVLAVLVEVGEGQNGKVSSDDVARIRSLLAALREKLQSSLSQLAQNENASITEFGARVERTKNVLQLLEGTQARLSAYIAQMQACITKEDDIINSATSKRIRNQNILNFGTDMCNAFETEYNDATSARRREVELLGRLRTFVEQRADEFASYGGDINEVFTTYSKTGSQQAKDAQFLQLRANLRQRKI